MIERMNTGPVVKADLMTSREVAGRLRMSVRTLWRLVAAGRFPQPVRYNRKLVRWKCSDVNGYFDTLAAA